MISEYEKQATDFLNQTKTTFTATFNRVGKHFSGDEQERDIYTIILQNRKHVYSFEFGQSLNSSGRYLIVCRFNTNPVCPIAFTHSVSNELETCHLYKSLPVQNINSVRDIITTVPVKEWKLLTAEQFRHHNKPIAKIKNENYSSPTAYDVLACLTKYEPESFSDFCSDYGYSTDSISATRVYQAVCDEWNNIKRLWTESELELLSEIQ